MTNPIPLYRGGTLNPITGGIFNRQLAMAAKAGNTQAGKLLNQLTNPPKKSTATPSVFTNTTVNQGATFAPININATPISGNISLFGGGGGGGISTNISQISQPTSNVSTQVSNTFTTTNTPSYFTTTNVSNITSSPFAGSNQTTTPSVSVTPTVTPSQVTTQTATPTATTAQTAGTGGGMEWWQYLLIGGVAIVGIYYVSKAFMGNKKKVLKNG